MTQALFIHSAGPQGPGEGSTALLTDLQKRLPANFSLRAPLMPKPDSPEAEAWIEALHVAIGEMGGDFVLVGHSLGGSTALQVLDRFGIPPNLLGLVTLAAPFWGGPDWPYQDYALPTGAAERLKTLKKIIIMRGDHDEVVAADHPERYRGIVPQAEIRILPGIDHEAAQAAPHVIKAIQELAVW